MDENKRIEVKNDNTMLPILAQSWLRSYYKWVRAFDRLKVQYRSTKIENHKLNDEVKRFKAENAKLKKDYSELIYHAKVLADEHTENAEKQKDSIPIDERLLKFREQWESHVKHVREDISNDDIIELYNKGVTKPYRIAKILQERLREGKTQKDKEEIKVYYRTIVSRVKVLKKEGFIK